MAQQDILREYLVALGFKVNFGEQKKFEASLFVIDKKGLNLTKTIAGIALATDAMVKAFANNMQKLYYSSLKTGETAGNLQALAFGAKQVGVGGDQMIAMIEGMQRAIRMNPGLQGLLHDLGVNVKAGPADQLKQLVKVLGSMPSYMGARYASLFGIEPDQLLLMSKQMAVMEEAERTRKEFARSVSFDAEEAAKAGVEYTRTLSDLSEKLGMVKDAAALRLLPIFQSIAGVTQQVLADWIRILHTVKADEVLKALGIKKEEGGVVLHGDVDPRTPISKDIDARIDKAGGNRVLGFWDWFLHGNLLQGVKPIQGPTKPVHRMSGSVLDPAASAGAQMSFMDTLGLRNKNPGNLRNWNGEPKNQGFSVFGSFGEGLSAMAGNLLKYADKGWDSVRKIAEHWAPRSENDTKAYIANLSRQLGVGEDSSLNLKDPETLRKVMGAIITNEQGRNPFSADTLNSAISGRLGTPAVQIQQTNTFHIHGGNAQDTADAVSGRQERASGDIVRDLRGVLR